MVSCIRIREAVRADVIAHAREEAPNECCGLLIGTDSVIDESVRVRNVHPTPATRYLLDPAAHIATIRRLRGTDRSVIGSYHSHPHSAPIPSETDLAEAYYPGFIWVIVSPRAPAVAAYRLSSGGFMSLDLMLAPSDVDMPGGYVRNIIDSIRDEFLRYKALGEGAIRQLNDAELSTSAPGGGNSIATMCWHISGNLTSRFTDFLTSDGEKPWRNREEEFQARSVTSAELLQKWDQGWSVLLTCLAELSDDHLEHEVAIRGQSLKVHQALHRSLAHTSYHVGQIVYVAKSIRGDAWAYLSIPPGASAEYNRNPAFERAAAQAAALNERSHPD